MDHVYDAGAFLKEIRRLLTADGRVLLEVMDYNKEAPGSFEALYWRSADDLLDLFSAAGLRVESTMSFRIPWVGTRFEMVADV